MSLLPQASKVSMPFLGQWLRRVWHAETEKKKRKKTEVNWPSEESWSKESHLAIFVCEFQREKDTEKESASAWVVQSEWRDRECECERVKKKKETFFFAQVTHKKDKLVDFSWSFWVLQPWRVEVFRGRFCYWLCGEIVFTPWDLFVVYPIYCEHKFSINLIVVISIS